RAEDYSGKAVGAWVPDGPVWAIATTASRIYLGGEFSKLTNPVTGASVARDNLAAIDRSSGDPVAGWAPSVVGNSAELDSAGLRTNPAVAALAIGPGDSVFVGGDFASIGGTSQRFAAKVSPGGSVSSAWRPNLDDRVWDFDVRGSRVYVAGRFTKAGGLDRRGVAKLSTTNAAADSGWNARVGGAGAVRAVAVGDGTVYLGGTFERIGTREQSFLASVDAGSGADTGWAPAPQCGSDAVPCRTWDLAVDSSRVYAAIGGEPGGKAVAWATAPRRNAPVWSARTDGDVQAVTVRDGVAYFGGHFGAQVTSTNGTRSRRQFFAANAATGAVLPYRLPARGPDYPGLLALQADATALRVGGRTRIRARVSGKPYRNFAVFPAPKVTIAGPGTPTTRLSFKLKGNGCKKVCRVRLGQRHGKATWWISPWRTATARKVAFTVPTGATRGLTVMVKTRWESPARRATEVVMRYEGKPVGARIKKKAAATGGNGTSCWAGTTAGSVSFKVKVRRVSVGTKRFPRAWTAKTRRHLGPMYKTRKGALRPKSPTACR
ncbi:MAG: hypothetical protein ACRCYQ_06250, partial [Nocardioides sp.]